MVHEEAPSNTTSAGSRRSRDAAVAATTVTTDTTSTSDFGNGGPNITLPAKPFTSAFGNEGHKATLPARPLAITTTNTRTTFVALPAWPPIPRPAATNDAILAGSWGIWFRRIYFPQSFPIQTLKMKPHSRIKLLANPGYMCNAYDAYVYFDHLN